MITSTRSSEAVRSVMCFFPVSGAICFILPYETVTASQTSAASDIASSSHVASQVAGVRPVRCGRVTTPEAPTWSGAVKAIDPSALIRPETPLVVTTRISRRSSMARARVIANCCSIWPVPWYMALLDCTTITWPPWVTVS